MGVSRSRSCSRMWASVAAVLLLSQGWLFVEAEQTKQAEEAQKFVQRPTCVQKRTMPEIFPREPDLWSTLTTPGWCLDKCVAKNFTVAGVHGALCRCGHSSPTFARVHLSQCSWKCEVDRNQTCGGPEHLSVVGPGYPSVYTEDIALEEGEEEEAEDDPLSLTTSSFSDASQTTTISSVGNDQLFFSEIIHK